MKKTVLFFMLLAFTALKAQIVNIPDANFKAILLAANTTNIIAKDVNDNAMLIDTNGDGEIQNSEAANVYKLQVDDSYISSLTGIEAFVNLRALNCNNNDLTSFDISQNINLTDLRFNNNQLASLNISQNTSLTYLECIYNSMSSLNVSQNINLTHLDCQGNYSISNLDVSQNINLAYLDCSFTSIDSLNLSQNINLTYLDCTVLQLTSLDISQNTNLTYLNLESNELTYLDMSQNTNLTYLNLENNNIATLDFSQNINLIELNCSYNSSITTLDLSNNVNLVGLNCGWNSNLSYVNLKNGNNVNFSDQYPTSSFYNVSNLETVCVDVTNSSLTNYISTEVDNVVFTSYCSFSPAQSNIIMGTAFLDLDNNGCDAQDIVFDNYLITANNGTESFATYAQQDASYSIFTGEGSFTTSLTANLPSYFSANPASYTNTFTGFDNTFTADFCITANQTVNDINISIVPTEARPGFPVSYRVIYQNVGTTQLSGNLTFNFDNTKMDFSNATETPSSQTTNELTFDYINLNPFETRVITLDFNVHTPTATEPTNIGDSLGFTAIIYPTTGDYTINDNTFTFKQTVIGSYDPNDMLCTEGDEILLADAANYLHYVIRFQNTGTADAINVVVKNILDDKLDWSTLQLESTSHTSRVAIKNGNDVEFIFEDIYLPDSTTDEAGSHGYIAYKIKPKDNVALGDVFNNTADIFFDYNAAIVTNTASTTIVNALSVNDAQLLQFSVYPTPSKGLLNISSRTGVKNVAIYSKLGQLVLEAANTQQVTIASLAKGLYFVKVTDENGDFGVRKIIKE